METIIIPWIPILKDHFYEKFSFQRDHIDMIGQELKEEQSSYKEEKKISERTSSLLERIRSIDKEFQNLEKKRKMVQGLEAELKQSLIHLSKIRLDPGLRDMISRIEESREPTESLNDVLRKNLGPDYSCKKAARFILGDTKVKSGFDVVELAPLFRSALNKAGIKHHGYYEIGDAIEKTLFNGIKESIKREDKSLTEKKEANNVRLDSDLAYYQKQIKISKIRALWIQPIGYEDDSKLADKIDLLRKELQTLCEGALWLVKSFGEVRRENMEISEMKHEFFMQRFGLEIEATSQNIQNELNPKPGDVISNLMYEKFSSKEEADTWLLSEIKGKVQTKDEIRGFIREMKKRYNGFDLLENEIKINLQQNVSNNRNLKLR